mmetsp:Transcript_77777/g.252012  ORF Transcript_77777/g.252012 Transcript_77777/m.252012 type:complete len:240 (-) Transcript_77777:1633-2352(-)
MQRSWRNCPRRRPRTKMSSRRRRPCPPWTRRQTAPAAAAANARSRPRAVLMPMVVARRARLRSLPVRPASFPMPRTAPLRRGHRYPTVLTKVLCGRREGTLMQQRPTMPPRQCCHRRRRWRPMVPTSTAAAARTWQSGTRMQTRARPQTRPRRPWCRPLHGRRCMHRIRSYARSVWTRSWRARSAPEPAGTPAASTSSIGIALSSGSESRLSAQCATHHSTITGSSRWIQSRAVRSITA